MKLKFDICPEITESMELCILGVHFHGNPFHSTQEWNQENEIGKLWQRFMSISHQYHFLLEKISTEPNIGYEIHYEPANFLSTNEFSIFVGINAEFISDIPLDFIYKPFPKINYAKITSKVQDHNNIEQFLDKWLTSNTLGYRQAYPYIVQRYSETYLGLDDPNSEMQWMIPVIKE